MLIVGIDIGTSYSSISILDQDGKPQPVKVSNGACIFGDNYSMPSAVYVDSTGTILIGQLAVSAKMKDPSNFKDEFKRDLGQKVPYNLGALQLMPEDLYKEIFIHFKKCAEEAEGEKISKAYITYPANFGKRKRELVELAAKKAGLMDVEMIDEPTAAAYCYCTKGKIKEGDKLLVYDFGGGTFDVAFIEYTSQGFKPVTQALGIDKCGGIDIDRLIFEDIYNSIPVDAIEILKKNEMVLKRFHAQIMELSIKIKHQLSSTESFKDGIPVGFDYVEYELTREKLNEIIAPLVEETLTQVKNIVKNADMKMDDISTCLLVGGTSRMPYIRERLEELTGKPVYKDIDPELAVCMGAALWEKEQNHFGYKIDMKKDHYNAEIHLEQEREQNLKREKQYIVGIDFGTTSSSVAVFKDKVPIVINSQEGNRTTPSIIAFSKDGEKLIGESAKRQAITNSNRTVSSIKRLIETDRNIEIGNKKYKPQEIIAMLLQKLRVDAENYLDNVVEEAVITVPSYFTNTQRQIIKEAGDIAGLTIIRIIKETSAVALAYGLQNQFEQKIMVYHLGGGYFDVSTLEIGDGVIEVLATHGANNLGGDDFKDRIINYLVEEFKKTERIDLKQDKMAMQRLHEAAEKAKKELSIVTATDITLPFITANQEGPKHLDITLTRAKFNELVSDLIEKTMNSIKNVLSHTGIRANELDKVILVGGSTRIPAVQEAVKNITGKEPFKGIGFDESAAIGAAIQGGKLCEEEGIGDIILLEAVSLSYGIETVGGVLTKLIERNTTIPTKHSQLFSTTVDNQTALDLHVVQGDDSMVKDNKTLAKFRFEGISPAPKGIPQIEVTFDVDTNEKLIVTAKDLRTGRELQVTIPSPIHSIYNFGQYRLGIYDEDLNIKTALELYQNKQFDEAFELLNHMTEINHREVQYHLGLCYAKGRGVSKNKEKAIQWFEKAAESGHTIAQENLDILTARYAN